jgi:hypothetical protein
MSDIITNSNNTNSISSNSSNNSSKRVLNFEVKLSEHCIVNTSIKCH